MAKMRFAVIGAGMLGRSHAQMFADHDAVEVATVCDIDGERARALAQSLGIPRWTTDYTDITNDRSIVAVGVATPDFAHTEATLAALRAGQHVLVEKPMATTAAECAEMIAAARQAKVKLMVDFHNRWSPPFNVIKQALDAGDIGQALHIIIRLNDTIFVPLEYISWAARSTVAWFLASHCLDTMHWLLGERVSRVYCMRRARVLQPQGITTPDYYQTAVEFPSGATALMENSWVLPLTSANIFDFKFELVGNKGAFYVDTSHNRMIEQYTAAGPKYPDTIGGTVVQGRAGGFANESIRHFVDCVVNDRQPLVTGEDGLAATRVIEAMEQSADTRQPVDINW